MSPEKELSDLIAKRLLNVAPDDQDLQLEDSDWLLIINALSHYAMQEYGDDQDQSQATDVVAWEHCLVGPDGSQYDREVSESGEHPFGRPGHHYDASLSIVSCPLKRDFTQSPTLKSPRGCIR